MKKTPIIDIKGSRGIRCPYCKGFPVNDIENRGYNEKKNIAHWYCWTCMKKFTTPFTKEVEEYLQGEYEEAEWEAEMEQKIKFGELGIPTERRALVGRFLKEKK